MRRKHQRKNKGLEKMVRKYTVDIAEAARKLGTTPSVIYTRMRKWGWTLEEATTIPLRGGRYAKKEISDKEVYGGCKKYKTFDESCVRGTKIFCDYVPEKIQDETKYTYLGGWRIVYLNYIKKGEYKFQAFNTDGREYLTNDPIEIYSILEEIFANLCGKFQK